MTEVEEQVGAAGRTRQQVCAVSLRVAGGTLPFPASRLPFGKGGLALPGLQTFSQEDRNPDYFKCPNEMMATNSKL